MRENNKCRLLRRRLGVVSALVLELRRATQNELMLARTELELCGIYFELCFLCVAFIAEKPFQRFLLEMYNGRIFEVNHPDAVIADRRDVTLVMPDDSPKALPMSKEECTAIEREMHEQTVQEAVSSADGDIPKKLCLV